MTLRKSSLRKAAISVLVLAHAAASEAAETSRPAPGMRSPAPASQATSFAPSAVATVDDISKRFVHVGNADAKRALLESYKTPIAADLMSTLLASEACGPTDASKLVTKTTIEVPKDFSTVQAAIDAAPPGSQIVLDPAMTYKENLVISGKSVVLASSSPSQKALLRAASASKPNITFRCNGGGKLVSLDIAGGSTGIKASSKDQKGAFSIADSSITNVGTGISSFESVIAISSTTFSNIAGRAIVVAKSPGTIVGSEFKNIGKTAIFASPASGLEIQKNTFHSPLGEGAIYVEGGAAKVQQNDFKLDSDPFAIALSFGKTSKTSSAAFEVTGNTISGALGGGIIVIGNGHSSTSAYVASNTIKGPKLPATKALPKIQWLDALNDEAKKSGIDNLLETYGGLVQANLKTDTRLNDVQETTRGLLFSSVCGVYQGNTSTKNFYGLVTLGSPKACSLTEAVKKEESLCACLVATNKTGCPPPTAPQMIKHKQMCNLIYANQQNHVTDQGLFVPPPPELAP